MTQNYSGTRVADRISQETIDFIKKSVIDLCKSKPGWYQFITTETIEPGLIGLVKLGSIKIERCNLDYPHLNHPGHFFSGIEVRVWTNGRHWHLGFVTDHGGRMPVAMLDLALMDQTLFPFNEEEHRQKIEQSMVAAMNAEEEALKKERSTATA